MCVCVCVCVCVFRLIPRMDIFISILSLIVLFIVCTKGVKGSINFIISIVYLDIVCVTNLCLFVYIGDVLGVIIIIIIIYNSSLKNNIQNSHIRVINN